MKRNLLACFAAIGLAGTHCGDNSNVVGNLFADGGTGGSGGSLDTSVGPGPATSTSSVGTGSGGSSSSSATGTAGSTAAGGMSGAGGSVGGTGGSAGSSGGGNPFPCINPMEVTAPPSGYVRCSNNMVHRPEKKQCPETIPRAEVLTDAGAGCHRDADCQAKPHGYCEYSSGLAGSGWGCRYGCVRDDECATGQICLCGSPTGRCVDTSGCTVDADCGGALMCVGYHEPCEQLRFACQTAQDQCGGDFDCRGPSCSSGCACQKTATQATCVPRCVALTE